MKFSQYAQIKEEESKEKSFITSKIKLQKNTGSKEFAPFYVNKNSHSNLRPLIKAFASSNQVGVGYTTIDKSKGEVEPQLKKKILYLTGGAVRDHLKGKTPKNYDIVTDATVSEIKMILSKSEENFVEIKPKDLKHNHESRYEKLPENSAGHKVFYFSKWDKQGKELEFTIEINNEEFHLATLSKNTKSRNVEPEDKQTAASIEEDAANRDLTINSLYIPLTNPDGDNNELIDPYGGATDLKNNEMKFVGDNIADRVKEDPNMALRFLRINSRYGNPDTMPEEYQKTFQNNMNKVAELPRELVKKEFVKGLEHPDSDPRKFMKMAHSIDLLSVLFPNIEFDPNEMPDNFKGDRWMSTAWVLKDNDPEMVYDLLSSGGWTSQEARDIAYLVRIYNWSSKNNFDPKDSHEIKNSNIGLTKSKIKDWMKMVAYQKG